MELQERKKVFTKIYFYYVNSEEINHGLDGRWASSGAETLVAG